MQADLSDMNIPGLQAEIIALEGERGDLAQAQIRIRNRLGDLNAILATPGLSAETRSATVDELRRAEAEAQTIPGRIMGADVRIRAAITWLETLERQAEQARHLLKTAPAHREKLEHARDQAARQLEQAELTLARHNDEVAAVWAELRNLTGSADLEPPAIFSRRATTGNQ